MNMSDLTEAAVCRACVPGRIDSPTRLRLLKQTGLLEGNHPRLDRLTGLCSKLLNVPVVMVSFVDIDWQVFASHQGLTSPWKERGETPLSHSFCQYVVTDGEPLIVEDAREDERLRTNRATKELNVIAYAGFPVVCQEQVMGSFCAIRPDPHSWTGLELQLLGEFADTVSDQIELQLECDELKQTMGNLRRANEELENLADVLAHDLKAPIRGIRSSIYLVECMSDDLSGDTMERLKDVDSSAERLTELIDTLSNFSNALHTSEEVAEIDLDLLFAEVRKDLVDEISDRKAVVERETSLGTLHGIRPLVRQLFQNLIANAMKFQPPGQEPKIRVGQRASDGAFYVQDNGVGIPAKSQEKIFELYRRGPQSAAYEGMGLGLAICARVVSKHNGRIWVHSEPGEGSTFFFTLRMRKYDEDDGNG